MTTRLYDALRSVIRRAIAPNLVMEISQQIIAAVNIADNINPLSRRNGGRRNLLSFRCNQ